jgi:hypothetical protein
MSDTINSMKLVPADLLKPDQLMEGDLIKIGEDIVEVIGISSDGAADNWFIETKDEFGEKETFTFYHTETIPLYAFIETME